MHGLGWHIADNKRQDKVPIGSVQPVRDLWAIIVVGYALTSNSKSSPRFPLWGLNYAETFSPSAFLSQSDFQPTTLKDGLYVSSEAT